MSENEVNRSWIIQPASVIGHCEVKLGNDGVAIIIANVGKYREAEAHAKLISASPDLLAALKMVLDASYDQDGNAGSVRYDAHPKIISSAQAAIAKAES